MKEKLILKERITSYRQCYELSNEKGNFIKIILDNINQLEEIDLEDELLKMSFNLSIIEIYNIFSKKVRNIKRLNMKKGYIKPTIKYEEVVEEKLIIENHQLIELKTKGIVDDIHYIIEKDKEKIVISFDNLDEEDLNREVNILAIKNDIKKLIKTK